MSPASSDFITWDRVYEGEGALERIQTYVGISVILVCVNIFRPERRKLRGEYCPHSTYLNPLTSYIHAKTFICFRLDRVRPVCETSNLVLS